MRATFTPAGLAARASGLAWFNACQTRLCRNRGCVPPQCQDFARRWTELKRLGLPVICIDARHAKAVLKMQINKSDRNDSAGIARIMQTGWFKEVRVKDLDSHTLKALLVSRALLVKIKRDLENQIRGLLNNVGLVIDRATFNVFAVRAEELIEDRPELISGRTAAQGT